MFNVILVFRAVARTVYIEFKQGPKRNTQKQYKFSKKRLSQICWDKKRATSYSRANTRTSMERYLRDLPFLL